MKPDNEPTPDQDERRLVYFKKRIRAFRQEIDILRYKEQVMCEEYTAIKARQKARGKQ